MREASLDVDAAYPVGTAASVGQAGTLTAFQTTADNTMNSDGYYQKFQDTAAPSTNPVLVTVTGPGGGTGSAFCIVEYVVTPNP